MKTVKFLVPKGIGSLETSPFAIPDCKKAYLLCLLARKEKLSIQELKIVEKMGFDLKIIYEE